MIYIGNKYKSNCIGVELVFINLLMDVVIVEIDILLLFIDSVLDYLICLFEVRRGYLQWLVEGCKFFIVDIGYVFLFFYGLEYCVFIDVVIDLIVKKEFFIIEVEINCLLNIYRKNNVFNYYVQNLLVYIF